MVDDLQQDWINQVGVPKKKHQLTVQVPKNPMAHGITMALITKTFEATSQGPKNEVF